jgi:cell division protein FtsB
LEELASAQSTAAAAQSELEELRNQNKAFQREIAQLRKSAHLTTSTNGNGKREVRSPS